jgi:hypothetical protein
MRSLRIEMHKTKAIAHFSSLFLRSLFVLCTGCAVHFQAPLWDRQLLHYSFGLLVLADGI